MKRQAYTLIAMIVLVGTIAVAAKAQTNGRTQLIASIPFEFNVGEKTLPAGEYRVQSVNGSFVRIQSEDRKTSAIVLSTSVIGKARDEAKLIFHRYGNRYFLSQAWVDGETEGLQVPKPRAERAMQRELAEMKKAGESVAIAAVRH
jgi:hypothetical protein